MHTTRWKHWLLAIWRLPASCAILLVRVYQWTISPLLGPNCRFTPSCSQYAVEALRRDGLIRGSIKSVGRICRCHPFHPGDFDPP